MTATGAGYLVPSIFTTQSHRTPLNFGALTYRVGKILFPVGSEADQRNLP
jgi:hypothetical protein